MLLDLVYMVLAIAFFAVCWLSRKLAIVSSAGNRLWTLSLPRNGSFPVCVSSLRVCYAPE